MRGRATTAICAFLSATLPVAAQHDLGARLDELEAGIARYKAQASREPWLTQRRADEVRALVLDVLLDADTRFNLRDGGGALLPAAAFGAIDRGPLQIEIEARFLLVSNHFLDDVGVSFDDDDDHRTGFENPQTRATLGGELNGALFRLQGDFNEGGEMRLQDAWIGRRVGSSTFIQAGQFKPPFALESQIDDFDLTTILRSIQARAAAERVQSIKVTLTPTDRARVAASINDGIASANTPWDVEDVEAAITVRAEILAVSNFHNDLGIGNFDDFFAQPGSGNGLLIGGGVHYQKGESGTPADEVDLLSATADATIKLNGFVLHGAGFYNDIDNGLDARTAGTVLMVVPTIVNGDIQLFLRHEFIDIELGDDDSDGQILSVGANRFIGPERQIKLTGEVGYTDGIPFLSDIPVLGSLFRGRDFRGGDREELVIMIQAQISTDHEW